MIGVIIWHGLWDFLVLSTAFSVSIINYISWQNKVIVNFVIDIVNFFVIMAIMVPLFKRLKSTRFYTPSQEEVIMVEEIVEVEEIPPS